MSTGADCRFVEKKLNGWHYEIQQWPYGEWPEYDEHGPFESLEEAEKHLHEHYANPGGADIERLGD